MENDRSPFVKPNPQSKLQLKRNNSDSSQKAILNKNSEYKAKGPEDSRENNPHVDGRLCNPSKTEDSLADFKSPKGEKSKRPLISKFKVNAEKVKKKIIKSKPKITSRSRRSSLDQQSIESSFFKPQSSKPNEVNESFPCPVCLKPFKDDETCTNHMKSCAAKYNVSIKQLLDAKVLLNRQAEERKAMGLLAGPVISERKKAFRSKNYSTGDDPQLQLVLAMSESLYEAEKMEFEQAALLAGITPECVKEMSDEQHKSTLQGFGFTTNRSVSNSDIPNTKNKKKKLLGPTTLQTRSKEDKDRVLAERIACILTGDDALTQAQLNQTVNFNESVATILRSKILKKIEQIENKLWDRSRLTKKYNDFYIKEFKSKLINSINSLSEVNDFNFKDVKIDDEPDTQFFNTSIVYEPMEIDMTNNQEMNVNKSNIPNICNNNEMSLKTDYEKNITENWRKTLNDSLSSDIIIFVKDDKYIFAHRLVFSTQCTNILFHTEPNDTKIQSHIKEKICWPGKDQRSVLAFLEFIYCGTIVKYDDVFGKPDVLLQIENLAKLYKIPDLLTYIDKRQNAVSTEKIKDPNINHMNNLNDFNSQNVASMKKNSASTDNEILSSAEKIRKQNDGLIIDENVLYKKSFNNSLSISLNDRRFTSSPILFESDGEESLSVATNQRKISLGTNLNLKNPDIEVDYEKEIFKENCANANEHKSMNYEECTDAFKRTYMSPCIINQNVTKSPESQEDEISISTSFREDIQEAITPIILRSPESTNSSEEKIDDNYDIAVVLTPKPKKLDEKENTKCKIICNKKPANEEITLQSDLTMRLNDVIASRKMMKGDINISTDQKNEHSDRVSIHTAVTPPPSAETLLEPNNENMNKLKSDLSNFINKVRRCNARGIEDSDSEIDTPHPIGKFRNPFSKKLQDDSYAYLRNDGRGFEQRKRALSLLEDDVLKGEEKLNKPCNDSYLVTAQNIRNDTSFDIHVEANNSSLNDTQTEKDNSTKRFIKNVRKKNLEVTTSDYHDNNDDDDDDDDVLDITENETGISLYSQYKKYNKEENSIMKYREKLDFIAMNSPGQKYNKNANNEQNRQKRAKISSKEEFISKTVSKRSVTHTEDVTLVSDSDDESILQSKLDRRENTSVDPKEREDAQKSVSSADVSNIENESTFPLELVDERVKGMSIVTRTKATVAKEVEGHVIDLSLDSDEDEMNDDSTFPYNLVVGLDDSLKKEKLKNENSRRNKNQDYLSGKENDDIDMKLGKVSGSKEGFLGRGDHSSDEYRKTEEELENRKKAPLEAEKENQQKIINLSPISIISSPEDDSCKISVRSAQKCSERNLTVENDKVDDLGENDPNMIANEFFEEIDFDEWNDRATPPREEVKSMNKYKSTPRSKAMPSPVSSPRLSQTKRSCKVRASANRKSTDQRLDEKAPKLDAKSASALDFTEKSKESRSYESGASRKSEAREGSVTPPLNYSLLESPELRRELNKYGLKSSIDRKNAKVLLKHIYEETHPQVALAQKRTVSSSSNEDEGPPPKRQHVNINKLNSSSPSKESKALPDKKNVRRSSRRCSSRDRGDAAQSSQSRAVIAEEMDYDEPGVDDSETCVNIRDAFHKLIQTDKELHTKVLTYEPISLETLRRTLKQNGLKCKMNDLMDFLDEQCITFQVQAGKGSRAKKKKN